MEARITIDKTEYDDLLEYKKAYDENKYVIKHVIKTYSTVHVSIRTVPLDDALKALFKINKELHKKIEVLENKKWWEVLICKVKK